MKTIKAGGHRHIPVGSVVENMLAHGITAQVRIGRYGGAAKAWARG